MRYVFVDDSIAYDGYTPLRRALGGAEKAVAGLAAALAERGNEVKVINHTAYAHMADGAYYAPFGDAMAPKSADILIAVRKPALLGTLRNVQHRMLWVTRAPEYLWAPANKPLWGSFLPSLLFASPSQQRAYGGELPQVLVIPGVRNVYHEPPVRYVPPSDPPPGSDPLSYAMEAAAQAIPEPVPANFVPPPHAVTTTHPLHGLAWLLDIWTNHIHPQMPEARLSVYSAVLSKGLKGEEIPAEIMPVLEKVKSAATANVVAVEPRADDGMAEVYRASRVHLYPGQAQDFACWTLAESQATGLPAVARSLGGTSEQIVNGESGYLVPNAAAFGNVTLEILRNDAVYKNLRDGAARPERRRTWAAAAAELEAFVAELPASAA